ncbi:hypothetical protein Tco_1065163 [Tanacetum coccineum]
MNCMHTGLTHRYRLPHRFAGVLDSDSGRTDFTSIGTVGQLSAAQGQIQALQARDPTHANDPEGADSCA